VWAETCFMIDTLEQGGAQTQLLLMAKHLKENKLPLYNLIVFREPFTLLKEFRAAGVNVLIIQKKREIDLVFIFSLIKCLRILRPKIVITFLITADMWGRMASLLLGIPVIGSSVRSLPQELGFFRNLFLYMMDKFSDIIICNSRMAAEITLQRSQLPKDHVLVIYNGVDPHSGMLTPPVTRKKTIGLVARLIPLKDVSTLLRAFARISSQVTARIIIVGDGPSRSLLEKEAEQLGIAHSIFFTGERNDAKEIIKEFHIGVLTSKYEGLSNVIMEYMCAGKPVVATNVGGNPELVEDGVTGFLFDPGDEIHLADILHRLLSTPDCGARMGSAGRDKMVDNFSVAEMVSAWNAALTKAISSANGRTKFNN
jgi:glycosyltransferase involved in cell wall biosynthesis